MLERLRTTSYRLAFILQLLNSWIFMSENGETHFRFGSRIGDREAKLTALAGVCGDEILWNFFGEKEMKYYHVYDSPVGPLQMISNGSALIGLHFSNSAEAITSVVDPKVSPFPETADQLDKYFAGSLEEFDLPIVFNGSDFQIRAWKELRNIPYGETISYKMQAEKIGSVPRAVGLANGQNPVCIIVPCHRVIGANGSLVGFGGGLNRKRALLQFEANVLDFGPQPFFRLR
jgi:methylated-DNA-[protein]-cysteine S-methyltransferase